ncbi:Formyltransferase [Irpex rosettiformis]|uniref:Formyltransferase n=1 Tax=Irpex rosettiformis TaxID=378272 RepID=A0ACB8TZA5_9APHY|nr:Formyltransferase [Irpex rosettiformis]
MFGSYLKLCRQARLKPASVTKYTPWLGLRRRYVHGSIEGTTNTSPFEILYFGRDEFSCIVLEQLYAAEDVWRNISIVTQPDVKVGRRSSQLSISPLKSLGERLKLHVYTIPEERKAFRYWQPPAPFDQLPTSPSHLLVTASFGRILSNSLLQRFEPKRRLNVHPSLLPVYRGPAPIQHALIDGLKETGVCVIEMTEYKKGIDSGDVWGQRRMSIPEDYAFPALRDALALEGGRLLVKVLRNMMSGTGIPTPQRVTENFRYAPLITANDALLDFKSMTAQDVVQRHKAISHQKAVFAKLNTGKTVRLHDPVVVENPSDTTLGFISEPGLAIYEPYSKSLHIRCASDTVLAVRKLQLQDKIALDARAWWNGVRPEMRFAPFSENGSIVFV